MFIIFLLFCSLTIDQTNIFSEFFIQLVIHICIKHSGLDLPIYSTLMANRTLLIINSKSHHESDHSNLSMKSKILKSLCKKLSKCRDAEKCHSRQHIIYRSWIATSCLCCQEEMKWLTMGFHHSFLQLCMSKWLSPKFKKIYFYL